LPRIRHNEHAPALILGILQNEIKMKPFDLGALALKEDILDTRDGIKACQDLRACLCTKIERLNK